MDIKKNRVCFVLIVILISDCFPQAAVRELRKTYIAEKRKAIDQREAVISKMEKKDKDLDDRNMEKS